MALMELSGGPDAVPDIVAAPASTSRAQGERGQTGAVAPQRGHSGNFAFPPFVC